MRRVRGREGGGGPQGGGVLACGGLPRGGGRRILLLRYRAGHLPSARACLLLTDDDAGLGQGTELAIPKALYARLEVTYAREGALL